MKLKDIEKLNFKLATYTEYINNRLKQQNDLLMTVIDNGIKYLFLVNAGGCIGVVSFYSADPSLIKAKWTWLVLGSFFGGLLLVGIFHIQRFRYLNNAVKTFYRNSIDFYKNQIEFEKITDEDANLTSKIDVIRWFAYASFFCIIFAGAILICNVMNNSFN